MSIVESLNYPYKLYNAPYILSKICIKCKEIVLNQYAFFEVSYLNQDEGLLNSYELYMPPEDYAKWNDDSYVIEWVKNQMHLDKEEYIKYKYEGGSFCVLNIDVAYLKSADIVVGIFDENGIYTGSSRLIMDKPNYDIWVQSNEYLVQWIYNKLGKLPI